MNTLPQTTAQASSTQQPAPHGCTRNVRMGYSSNHKRGTGRSRVNAHGNPVAVDPATQYAILTTQVQVARNAGLNIGIYEMKLSQFVQAHPEFQEVAA